jgi:DNA invertase Pin-like site-specific DNA recombinase
MTPGIAFPSVTRMSAKPTKVVTSSVSRTLCSRAAHASTGRVCRTKKGRVHFVVVFNLTRFARDKYDHFALRSLLESLGISLRPATEPIDDTSTGKLTDGVLAAFAQFDNDVRADRTRAGMKAALELGRWVFLAPLVRRSCHTARAGR